LDLVVAAICRQFNMASVYRYLVSGPVVTKMRLDADFWLQQRSAHEQPVIFYSLALGGIGEPKPFGS